MELMASTRGLKRVPPYNHTDPPDKQLPLSIRLRDLSFNSPSLRSLPAIRVAIPTASGRLIRLKLLTDSVHLATFFSANWPADDSTYEPDARIVAGKESATYYGLSRDFNDFRWYCPDSRQVWMFGTEYYGNLKINVRGLCSELASDDDMFIHGCSLALDNCGLILSGMSGAGKTTLTAALRRRFASTILVVNDDWGPLSLSAGLMRNTGEPFLHMKYPSVRSLAPALSIGPNTHRSENFKGDFTDPAARLLVTPAEVFGQKGICDKAHLRLFVVVIRNDSEPLSLRPLSSADLSILETGHYSAFYHRSEQFLNGSLFLVDNARLVRTREQHRTLLDRFHCVALNNSGPPERGAELVISALQCI